MIWITAVPCEKAGFHCETPVVDVIEITTVPGSCFLLKTDSCFDSDRGHLRSVCVMMDPFCKAVSDDNFHKVNKPPLQRETAEAFDACMPYVVRRKGAYPGSLAQGCRSLCRT